MEALDVAVYHKHSYVKRPTSGVVHVEVFAQQVRV
jgi:hypothetical protein